MEPIEFRIIEDLQTALKTIQVAGGYFHDVEAVAVKLDADAKVEDIIGSAGARPYIVLEVTPTVIEYFPAEQMRFVMPLVIHFVNDSDPKLDPAMLKAFYRMGADAEKAISVDGTRGDLASDTIIRSQEKRTYEGALVWAQIGIEVRGNRTYGKPNG